MQSCKKYGITEDDFNSFLRKQGNVCAICKQPENVKDRALAIDHDHKTGIIRGLLCGDCNRALGLMQDSPKILRSAAKYIEDRLL